MGQKINPTGLRIGVIKDWESRWYADPNKFGDTLVEDYNLREYLLEKLAPAGVPKVEIERDAKRVYVNIHCAKPGMVIGRQGAEIEKLKKICEKKLGGKEVSLKLGARGIKTQVSGRLGGAEIARTESYHEGTIPLQTIRADIDYGFAEAKTTYGRIGVKVWLYKGEVLHESRNSSRPRRRREGGNR